MTILIVEDDVALCGGIELALSAPDRSFLPCHNLEQARRTLDRAEPIPDLMILDVNLPDGSGLCFCAQLRRTGCAVPILMLTANDTELDTVAGLNSGADDYMTKPFSLAVLRARIEALTRRAARGVEPRGEWVSDDGRLCLDFPSMRFEKEGHPLELSRTEARLLQVLTANHGQTVPRERLLELLWPDGSAFVEENALSVAVRRLRTKLEDDPAHPRWIRTVHGIGYRWTADR